MSQLRAHLPANHVSCWPMSPPVISTRIWPKASWILLTDINDQGTTIIMVTHEPSLAERAQRNIHVRDGQVYQGEADIHLAAQTA